jgi:hypothetical protein
MIFEKISHLIKKVFLPEKNKFFNLRNTISFGNEKIEENNKNSFDLIIPNVIYKNYFYFYFYSFLFFKSRMINKKFILKQPDIYYNLFANFLYKPNTDFEYILKILVFFINSLLGKLNLIKFYIYFYLFFFINNK